MSTHDDIFEAAARILLLDDRCVTLSFSPEASRSVSRRPGNLPSTSIPHYYVLPPRFGDGAGRLIRRAERVGISTTAAGGTQRLLSIMAERYPERAEEILGAAVFPALQARSGGYGRD